MEQKVILCFKCDGTGRIEIENRNGAYDTSTHVRLCPKCEGCGRLIEKISWEPLYRDDGSIPAKK